MEAEGTAFSIGDDGLPQSPCRKKAPCARGAPSQLGGGRGGKSRVRKAPAGKAPVPERNRPFWGEGGRAEKKASIQRFGSSSLKRCAGG